MPGIRVAVGVFLAALVSAASLAASFPPDDAIVDTLSLPRLPGAVPDPSRAESHSSGYSAPGSVVAVTAATRQLLISDGWQPYVDPLADMRHGGMHFKKGIQGLILSFTMAGGKADQSSVHYIAERVSMPLPFPADAANIVYDTGRPYLHLVTAGSPDATLKFYIAELEALVRGCCRGEVAEREARQRPHLLHARQSDDPARARKALRWYGRGRR
jgi:hypothetical protein